jgi:GNAT acetyltransferase-like protein
VDYRIEQLSSANIHHLIPLYRATFQKAVTLSHLLKKYETASLGAAFIGFIAFTRTGEAAAYYGAIPCIFAINGEEILAAQSADTMTHPDHRKKGLFTTLATRTYSLAREQKIQFIFGFPNQNSLPGFIRLNWKFLPDQLQIFVLKAHGFPYRRLLNRSPTLTAWYKMLVSNFLRTERISPSFFEQKDNGMKHDHSFVSYKTYNDTYTVAINTVKTWIKIDGKLKVGAVHGLNTGNVVSFLSGLKKLAFRLGCNDVIFITSKNSPLYQVLNKNLRSEDAFPIGFYPLQDRVFDFENISFEYCDIDIF